MVKDIVERAFKEGVYLFSEDEKLGFKLAKGACFDPALKQDIQNHKTEIITYLKRFSETNNSLKSPVKKRTRGVAVPLSFSQQRLWFIDQLEQGSCHYNIPMAMNVEGAFDVGVAEQALGRLIQRHESLRTVFSEGANGPVQVIRDNVEFHITVQDLTALSHTDQQRRVDQLLQRDASCAFDLTADLMVRASYLHLQRWDVERRGLLLFNMHHIASDGWSMEVLLKEFVVQYKSIVAGSANPLEPLSVQYADYAIWQRSWLTSGVLESQLKYWKTQLDGVPAVHGLPLDFPRPSFKAYKGGVIRGQLAAGPSQSLQTIAASESTTLFMLLHAVLSLVLSRHSHRDDIVIGTPVANRLHSQLQPLIGFFVNTLVLRTSHDFEYFTDYLAQVKQVNLAAQVNQDVPFEQLMELCQVVRCTAYTPLFQILFSMDSHEARALSLPGVEFSPVVSAWDTAKFDLELSVQVLPTGLHWHWVYDKALFTEAHIQQLSDHFQRLLHSVVEAPKAKLSALSMLSQAETRDTVQALNHTPSGGSRFKTIAELFELQTAACANRVALVVGSQSWTYAALNAASNRLAHHLVDQGVKAETLVGLCMAPSAEMVIGLLAVLKAGGAYVPLDPNYPKTRLEYMLSDTNLKYLLVQPGVTEALSLSDQTVVIPLHTAATGQRLEAYSSSNLNRAARQSAQQVNNALAYVIYTSGSTGLPKGVAVQQGGLINLLQWYVKEYGFDKNERFLLISSISFDLTQKNIFAPLISGGRLVLAHSTPYDPDDILGTIEKNQITVTNCAPSVFYPIVQKAREREFEPLRSVTKVLFGGEPINARAVLPWLRHSGCGTTIINMYGPTECTDVATQCTYLESGNSIGRPIDNVSVYVICRDGSVAPGGVVGELHVGGAGVARGYLNQPELTAKRFIHKSFFCQVSSHNLGPYSPQQRLYKTGDLVRRLPSGCLEFIGRIDDQVKIRGLRIELGEIEHRLNAVAGVLACCVLAREDEPGRKQLVAYVVLGQGDGVEKPEAVQEVRTHLAANLPDYMVPSAFVRLRQLPLTANGKVDKKALPAPDATLLQTTYVAPSTEVEHRLVTVWAQLLKLDKSALSITANFFEMGGDSILSIQVVSRCAQAGLHFSVKDLFRAQNIQGLSRLVNTASAVLAPQQTVVGEQLLLPIQRNFFAAEADLHHFNQSVMLCPPGHFSEAFLTAAVEQLYLRHDALRLGFIKAAGGWRGSYVRLDPHLLGSAVAVKDWDHNTFDTIEDYATSIQKTLRLDTAELFKAVYIRLKKHPSQGRLLLVFHHLVMDGVSWRIVLEDINTLYCQWLQRAELKLAAKTCSYQQWGKALLSHATCDVGKKEKAYWISACKHPVMNFLRLAPAKTQAETPLMSSAEFRLNREITEQLLTHCPRVYRTQVNELLLAGVFLAACRWRGEGAMRLDLESHGREGLGQRLDCSQTVGWFTSFYPLELRIKEDHLLHNQGSAAARNKLIETIICSVKEYCRGVPNNGLGFGALKYLSNDDALIDLPASELVFNYLGQFDQVVNDEMHFRSAPESTGQEMSENRQHTHALSMNGMVVEGQLGFSLSFDAASYDADALADFMSEVGTALKSVVSHCAATVQGCYTPSDFPLANMSKTDLSTWQKQGAIEDIYPATGMQQGLLFHSLLDKSCYVTQTVLTFNRLNTQCFKQAWQQVVTRHGALRTAFAGLDTGRAHQLVMAQVALAWVEHDLSELTDTEQEAQVETIRLQDKQQGFEPAKAPLMRMMLLKLGPVRNFDQQDEKIPVGHRYQFIWSNHHALMDGWCLPIIFSELSQCYGALQRGSLPQLPPARSYRDYAVWLSEQNLGAARVYWRKTLSELHRPTPLPLAEPSRLTPLHGAVIEQTLVFTAQQTEQLRRLAQSAQTTVNVVLQAAWALLLARYSGDKRVVFGATTSGRPASLPGVEQMVGLFINTVPVVVTLNSAVTVTAWLKQLHQQLIEREAYNHCPLHEIQALSPLKHGLFDSLLVFGRYGADDTLGSQADDAGLCIDRIQAYEETDYGLCLIADFSDTLLVKLSAQTHSFTQASLSQLTQNLRQLLGNLAHSCEQERGKSIDDVAMLSAKQFHYLTNELNQTHTDYPKEKLIAELFEMQVAAHPTEVALVFQSQQVTYDELNRASNRLAHCLNEQGVGSGTLVGLCLDRSVEMIMGILAILKAGGAYVPLDPNYPVARLQHILDDTQVAYLLTRCDTMNAWAVPGDTRMLGELKASVGLSLPSGLKVSNAVSFIPLDRADVQRQLESYCSTNPMPRAQQTRQSTAYVIYTSGSTGEPKGVEITQQGLSNYLHHAARCYLSGPAVGSVVSSSLCFDATLTTLLAPLLRGKRVELLVEDDQLLEALSHRLFTAAEPYLFKITPAHLEALQHTALAQGSACATAHQIIVGGEQFSFALLQRWKTNLLPRAHFVNEYGPTETVVGCSTFSVLDQKALSQVSGLAVPIGKPIQNTQLYVLDRGGRLVPQGAMGELYIGGDGVAQGYLNLPELTAERFIQNPFSEVSTSRLYKTGDLVRYLPSGNLEFIGRTDDQVKIRGFRIELAEVEHRLNQHEAVQSSQALVREDEPGEKHLVAYVVPALERASQAGFSPSDLGRACRTHLKHHLPDYMVPLAVIVLEQLPLTSNGKVDKKALPRPDRALLQENHIAPTTKTERALASIWERLLNLKPDTLSRNGNFFELGGDSLLAVRLTGEIRRAFEQEIPLKEVFDAPQLSMLAEKIYTGSKLALKPAIPVFDRNNNRLALSFAQQRLWFLHRLDGNALQYNMPIAVRVESVSIKKDCQDNRLCQGGAQPHIFDVNVAQRAMRRLIARHEPLRTVILEDSEGPVQAICDPFEFHFKVHDLSQLSEPDRQRQVAHLISQDARTSFDLSADLMVRASYVLMHQQAGNNSGILLFNMHHIASDGWSMGLLVNEFIAHYQAILAGNAEPLSPLPIQYVDYALWQRSWLKGDVLQQQLEYWALLLADAPSCHQLPLDKPRTSEPCAGGAVASELAPPLVAEIRACLRASNTTLFMFMQAALAVHIGRLSHETDVVMGSPTAGRVASELEPLIGLFLNTQVFRTEFADNPDLTGLLARTQQSHLASLQYNQVPFELVVDKVNPPRSLEHTPIFQVLINLNNTRVNSQKTIQGLEFIDIEPSHITSKYDLTLYITETKDNKAAAIELSWVFNSAIFHRETIKMVSQEFDYLLRQMVESPKTPVLDHAWKNPRSHLGSMAEARYSLPASSIGGLLQYWGETQPHTQALRVGQSQWTYQALNAQVNQLANFFLIHNLAAAGTRVAVATQRNAGRVKVILALMKVGACYIPLSEELPSERLQYMLTDSQATLVIADKKFIAENHWLQQYEACNPLSSVQKIVVIDHPETADKLSLQSVNNPVVAPPSDSSIAHIIYTSGSTGRPKGVLGTYAATYNRVAWMLSELPFQQYEHVAHLTSMAFIRGVWELLVPLCGGAKISIFPRALVRETDQLWRQLRSEKITRIVTTPSLMNALGYYCSSNLAFDTSLRHWFVSGEQLQLVDAKKILSLFSNLNLYNLYGSTEVMSDVLWSKISDCTQGYYAPAGKPIGCAQVVVSGRDGQPVAKGVVGELVVYGVSVAHGYTHAEPGVRQAFIETREGRAYRTGDLGRVLSNNTIECLGRADKQVKLRGYRIELGEIEHRLNQCKGVVSCLVVVLEDHPGEKSLVAYIVADSVAGSAVKLTNPDIKAYLAGVLPDYMVPSAFVILPQFPLTANGKINRSALPRPDVTHLEPNSLEVPVGATEITVLKIWQHLLNIEPIGRFDNFFSLGGHSLLIVRLSTQLNSAVKGANITVRDIVEKPTIAAISNLLDRRAPRAKINNTTVARDVSPETTIPVNASQVWLLNKDKAYQASMRRDLVFSVAERVNIDVIRQALTTVVNHHEGLRSRFVQANRQWHAEITEELTDYPLKYKDFTGMVTAEAIDQACFEFFLTVKDTLDIAQGPMLQVAYAKLKPGVADRLYFVIHHLVYDGVSLEIFFEDFQTAFQAHSLGQRPALARSASMGQVNRWSLNPEQGNKIFTEVRSWLRHHRASPLPNCFSLNADDVLQKNTMMGVETLCTTLRIVNEANFNIAELCKIALTNILCAWSGNRAVELLLVSALRYEISMATGLDLSRTLGFIAGAKVQVLSAMLGSTSRRLQALRQQVDAVPYGGLLNGKEDDPYVDENGESVLQKSVHFNFVNIFSAARADKNPGFDFYADTIAVKAEPIAANASRPVPTKAINNAVREELFNVTASLDTDRLMIRWAYNKNIHKKTTVQALVQAFEGEMLLMAPKFKAEKTKSLENDLA